MKSMAFRIAALLDVRDCSHSAKSLDAQCKLGDLRLQDVLRLPVSLKSINVTDKSLDSATKRRASMISFVMTTGVTSASSAMLNLRRDAGEGVDAVAKVGAEGVVGGLVLAVRSQSPM